MFSAYFAFRQDPDQEFVFQLIDAQKIEHARRIVSGTETDRVHVIGRVKLGKQPYNPEWSYHLDPTTINFFAAAIAVCDANMAYVEEHLDHAGDTFLPGFHWCPQDSRIFREVHPASPTADATRR